MPVIVKEAGWNFIWDAHSSVQLGTMSLDIDDPEASLIKTEALSQSDRTNRRQGLQRIFQSRSFCLNCIFTFFNLFFFACLLKGTSYSAPSSECEPSLIYCEFGLRALLSCLLTDLTSTRKRCCTAREEGHPRGIRG